MQKKEPKSISETVKSDIGLKALFFNQKVAIFFLLLDENICCGYSLEAPQRGASNEYPQHMFSSRNKKTIYLIPTLIKTYGPRAAETNSLSRTS